MDIYELTEHRFREVFRKLPPQLDAVIERAKRAEKEDEDNDAEDGPTGGPSELLGAGE